MADGLILTHGAGSNADAPLLVAVGEAFAAAGGFEVRRVNLAYRQARASGPPRPGDAAKDREGLRQAAAEMRSRINGRIFLGGQSYGGRQASMLLASDPAVAAGLLLLSYPLHPPRRPQELRTAHLPNLRAPALFVHGTRDPFGSIDEMRSAIALVPARTELLVVEGAGHDLAPLRRRAAEVVTAFQRVCIS